MADKVLTISVAGYNVEDYIEQTLDSCLIPSKDLLEVLIVDDGATDSTAAIADTYADRFPDVFRVVRKENGGYGSTVNTSIDIARGQYFKILDGDDWFDIDGLESLVNTLRDNDEVDLVVTPHVCQYETETKVVDQVKDVESGIYDFNNLKVPWRISMHSMCYRTQLLRDSGVRLTEHCFYTDGEYATFPLPAVHTVYVSHVPLYQYRLGREGQSVTFDSRIKHREDLVKVITHTIETYRSIPDKNTTAARITRAWIIANADTHFHTLFHMKRSDKVWQEIEALQDLVFGDDDIANAAFERSKWARIFSKATKRTYPFVAYGSKLYKKVR